MTTTTFLLIYRYFAEPSAKAPRFSPPKAFSRLLVRLRQLSCFPAGGRSRGGKGGRAVKASRSWLPAVVKGGEGGRVALLPGSWLPAAEVWTAARRGCDCHFPGPLALRGMAAAAGSSVVEALGRLWQVEALLGRGASAAVFQARCLGEPGVPLTALKEFLPPRSGLLALGGDVDHGFSNERAALEELRGHRNIVTLYSVFTNCSSAKGPSYCLLLELLDISVSELLVHSSQRGCSMWITQHCARDVLEALIYLHHKGYVHADLKPRNILWSAEEECFKLIDFGLSFKEGNQDVKYIQTDGYRAPEAELQNCLSKAGLHGGTECTSAVDLWSLGIILLEMFSGMKLKHIVQSQEWRANNSAFIDHIFANKSVINSAIPVYHLRDLLKSMLHNDQEKRATAAEALCSPFFSIPFAPHIEDLVMLPTPVLRLLNILSDASLQNEEEFEDVVDDIREECSKYGQIVSLFVPKESPGKGHVFVEYAHAGDSKAAQRALTGKRFNGKFVVATFYPLSAYRRGYLYHTVF